MKTAITTFFLLSISLGFSQKNLHGKTTKLSKQSFVGKATYKTHRSTSFPIDSTASDEMRKQIEEQMRRAFQRTYTLNFTKSESTYKQQAKLNQPKPQSGTSGVMVMSFGGGGMGDVTYKNLAETRYSNKMDLMGKTFLIKDQLPKYDWVLTGETKNIGTYTAYKATWTREEENRSMSLRDGEMKEENKKETRTTTAWYTLDIPVSNGPGNWWGLPGLILEVHDGRQTVVCTEIVLNPSDKVVIEEPKKGKVVTQDKYDELYRKKTREFINKSRSRNRGGGGSFQIRMGG